MPTGGLTREFSDRAILRALLDALESARLGCVIVIGGVEDSKVVYANNAYARMIGVPVAAAASKHPFRCVPAEDAAQLEHLRLSIRRRGSTLPIALPTRFMREDGTSVPVDFAFGYSLLDDRRATFCFIRDTVERTAMEAALHESEDRFRRLAEASPDAIAIFVDGHCVYANPKAVEIYEIDLKHVSRFETARLALPDEHDQLASYIDRVRRGDAVPSYVTQRRLMKGETKDLEASFSATTIGGRDAMLVFTRDITERQRLQAELLKADRLASLGVLAAGVAHELNNPLAALGLMLSRLKRAVTTDMPARELREDIAQVDEAVQRMSAIIGDLLFLARPAEHPHAHVDLAKVLASSVALLRAGISNCPAIVENVPALPPVKGVPSKLGQAVLNVLRNAIQACVAAGRTDAAVHLSARASDGEICIVVEDNGMGISEEDLPRLMTPFFTTKEGGTGLGLWITQGIMQSHGGRLELESTKGRGTKVILALPV